MAQIIPPSDSDLTTTILTLFGECRGEPPDGQLAVAYVIRTRAEIALAWEQEHHQNHPLFGDGSLGAVCKQPYQFSCWSLSGWNASNLAAMLALKPADTEFQKLSTVAHVMLNESISNPAPGATHYERIGTDASWADGKTPVATIGNHQFYKLP